VILNRRLAQALLPNENAIGRTVELPFPRGVQYFRVVGLRVTRSSIRHSTATSIRCCKRRLYPRTTAALKRALNTRFQHPLFMAENEPMPSRARSRTASLWPNLLRNWNLRVILVAICNVAAFRWLLAWPPGGSFTLGRTVSDRLWGLCPLFFRSLLALLFAVWAVKLLFEYLLRSRPVEYLTPAAGAVYQPATKPQSISAQANRITAMFLFALVLSLFLDWVFAKVVSVLWPGASSIVLIVHSVVFVGGTTAFVIYAMRRPARVLARPRTGDTRTGMNIAVTLLILGTLFALPVAKSIDVLLASVAGTLLYIPGWLLSWTWGAARRGQYELALRRAKICSTFPGYSKVIEADILNEAGRSAEAKALIKDEAFDAQGRPRLTDLALVVYAHATVAQGITLEGEQLLEAAVRLPQRVGIFHIALAELLLEEKKDVERATNLIEDAMATWKPQGRYRAWISLHRSAAHAWALAVSGRRNEAERELQRVSANLPSTANRDAAHLQRLLGETHVALGDLDAARAAFADATERDPQGYNGKKARNKLEALPK
jgi:hypothetical protein